MAEKSAKNRKRGTPFTADHQPDPDLLKKKKHKTVLKEKIGLDSWDSIQAYLVGEGAAKFIEEIKSMDGKDFANNYLAAMEYFKPKLARTELTGEINTQITEIRRTVISKKV